MSINILHHPTDDDWAMCYTLAMGTAGKQKTRCPSMEWRKSILDAEHSPIRHLTWIIEISDCPSWVATHFARHHVGVQPYVQSQRNDRQSNYDRNAARQDAPVLVRLELNAQSLIDISHRRLCHKAATETRELWEAVVQEIVKLNPEMAHVLVPMCVYRGGKCHEMYPCNSNPYRGAIDAQEKAGG